MFFYKAAAIAAIASFASVGAQAQPANYPAPGVPIKLIVPFAAGSGTDAISRTLASELAKRLDTSVVVDNRPGANGIIAAEAVRKAPADGYTLVLATSSGWSTNTWLIKDLSYDPVVDFTPIARTNLFPFVLAVKADPSVKNLDDFLKAGREKSMDAGYGNASGQVAGAHLMKAAAIKGVAVPYKSTPQALVDLVGGQVDFLFVDMAASRALIEGGKITPLAVMADQRSALMPELPALGETFPGFNYVGWGGLMGPSGLPPEVVTKLNDVTVAALQSPEVKEKMIALGLEPAPSTPDEFATFIEEQLKAWGDKVKEADLAPK